MFLNSSASCSALVAPEAAGRHKGGPGGCHTGEVWQQHGTSQLHQHPRRKAPSAPLGRSSVGVALSEQLTQPGAKDLAINPAGVHKSRGRNNIYSFKRLWGEGSLSVLFVVAPRHATTTEARGLKQARLVQNGACNVLEILDTSAAVCSFSNLTAMGLRNISIFFLGSPH